MFDGDEERIVCAIIFSVAVAIMLDLDYDRLELSNGVVHVCMSRLLQ